MLVHRKTGLKFSSAIKPWPHQVEAVDFLKRQGFGALYTKPGSGKTRVFVDLIYNAGYKKILVCAPLEALQDEVWERNINLFSLDRQISVLSTLQHSVKVWPRLIEKMASQAKSTYVVVINYESSWREPFKKWAMKPGRFDCVILDESHYIKGAGSKVSGFFATLARRVPHRFLCTGTPGGKPEDVYAQYRFLDTSIFGTRLADHKERYDNINIAATARAGYPVLYKDNPYKNLDELMDKAMSIAYHAEVDIELPPFKHIYYHYTPSTKTERILKEFNSKDENKRGFISTRKGDLSVADARHFAMRNQQILSGYIPVVDDYGEKHTVLYDTTRIEAAIRLIKRIGPDPIVIFAKYKQELADLRGAISEYLFEGVFELSGTKKELKQWQREEDDFGGRILLVQPQSGSQAIDLTRACHQIYYSKHHSAILYAQSMARIHRPPQDRPVKYYHLIADTKYSVDKEILRAHELGLDFMDYLVSGS